jgi:hypothetical protein
MSAPTEGENAFSVLTIDGTGITGRFPASPLTEVAHNGIEAAKPRCGKKHFAAIGVDDFAKSSREGWNL